MYLVDTRRPCSCTGTNSRRERKRTEAGYFRDTDVGSAKAATWAVAPSRLYRVLTVRRLRPLARRRFRTVRPFFVAMRTRKPWVRLRRRRLG